MSSDKPLTCACLIETLLNMATVLNADILLLIGNDVNTGIDDGLKWCVLWSLQKMKRTVAIPLSSYIISAITEI